MRGIKCLAAALLSVAALAAGVSHADLYVSGQDRSVGRYQEQTGAGGVIVPGDFSTLLHSGLAVGRKGDLYVSRSFAANAGDPIVTRHDALTGTTLGTFVVAPNAGFNAVALAFGPDENLYVTDAWTSSIWRYNGSTGDFIDIFVPSGSGGLGEPHGLAFSPDGGALMVSGDLNSDILKFSATTGMFQGTFTASDAQGSGQIAFGPDGHLYAARTFEGVVSRYDGVTGASLGTFASASAMSNPFGLAFDTDGSLYVTSGGDDRIYVFDGASGSLMRSFNAGGQDLGFLSYLAFSAPIPEPEMYFLWLSGLGLLAALFKRRNARK